MWRPFSHYGPILAYKNVTTGEENTNSQTQPNSKYIFTSFSRNIMILFSHICLDAKRTHHGRSFIINQIDLRISFRSLQVWNLFSVILTYLTMICGCSSNFIMPDIYLNTKSDIPYYQIRHTPYYRVRHIP